MMERLTSVRVSNRWSRVGHISTSIDPKKTEQTILTCEASPYLCCLVHPLQTDKRFSLERVKGVKICCTIFN